jgi:hypothetical protein
MFGTKFWYKKKKILFVVDVQGWAYDDRAKTWKSLLKDEFEIDILRLSEFPVGSYSSEFSIINRKIINAANEGVPLNCSRIVTDPSSVNYSFSDLGKIKKLKPVFDHKKYDGIVFFYHKAIADRRLLATPFPMNKVAVCINNEKWKEEGAEYFAKTFYSEVKILVGCNKYIVDSFSGLHPNVMRASQCVDSSVFFKDKNLNTKPKRRFTVGWSGNHSNPLKRVELIKKACNKAGVTLSIKKDLSRKDLNVWYNSIDIVICASESEGGPMLLLEAGAVGVPAITANVGLAREMVSHEKNGLILKEGSVKNIKELILKLKNKPDLVKAYGRRVHQEILKNWTYEARLHEIRGVLRAL